MKKFLYLASAATLTMVSCSDDLGLKNPNSPVIEGKSRIIATYPVGQDVDTRTSMGIDPSGKLAYYWNQGDAIGLYAMSGDKVNNAMFKYPESAPVMSGVFTGDVDLVEDNYYLAYYPYAEKTPYNGNSLTLTISQTQNYKSKYDNEGNGSNIPSGSFANGAAPAVAYAKAISDEEISFEFMPVASYLVLPVTGQLSKNVTSFTLTVSNNVISGDITVPIDKFIDAGGDGGALDGLKANGAYDGSITLEISGTGLDLAEGVTDLWFVVPQTLSLAGNTLTLTAYNGDTPLKSIEKTYAENWVWPANAQTQIGRNNVNYIWAGKETPFYLSDFNGYTIRTQSQFLEYANLVTQGAGNAVSAYNSLTTAQKPLSDLPNMLNPTTGQQIIDPSTGNIQNVASVKPALIATSLDFAYGSEGYQSVLDYLGIQQPSGFTGLGKYYEGVYDSYLFGDNHSIPTIGGTQSAYSIQGSMNEESENYSTISNLYIEGNGMFANINTTYRSNVKYLNLDGVTVDATSVELEEGDASTYLTTPNMVYNGVTVNNNCKLIANEASTVEGETVQGIFGSVYTQWFKLEWLGVTNNIPELPFAYKLLVNGNFAFSEEKTIGIKDFAHIVIPNNNGLVFGLTVENDFDDAEYLINNVNTYDGKNAYSILGEVVDGNPTKSYWTGMKCNYDNNKTEYFTAERLANLVQTSNLNSANVYNLGLNLDLMGTYEDANGEEAHMRWTNVGNDAGYQATEKAPCTISNVWIDGTSDGENYVGNGNNYFLNLFGNKNKVNYVNVDGITIAPVINDNTPTDLNISVISNWCVGGSSNISVSGLTIEADDVVTTNEVIGGLYSNISGSILDPDYSGFPSDLSIEPYEGSVGENDYGYLAGLLTWTVKTKTATLTNPYEYQEDYQPFGNVAITVEPEDNLYQTILTLNGFGTSYINAGNIDKYITVKVTSEPTSGIYSVQLNQDGTQTTWNYNFKTGKFTQWGN